MINRKQVVYKTELYKLYKRKDTWIFLTVILVPILYSVGIASGSEMEILQQSILYRRCFKWLNPCLFLILF